MVVAAPRAVLVPTAIQGYAQFYCNSHSLHDPSPRPRSSRLYHGITHHLVPLAVRFQRSAHGASNRDDLGSSLNWREPGYQLRRGRYSSSAVRYSQDYGLSHRYRSAGGVVALLNGRTRWNCIHLFGSDSAHDRGSYQAPQRNGNYDVLGALMIIERSESISCCLALVNSKI